MPEYVHRQIPTWHRFFWKYGQLQTFSWLLRYQSQRTSQKKTMRRRIFLDLCAFDPHASALRRCCARQLHRQDAMLVTSSLPWRWTFSWLIRGIAPVVWFPGLLVLGYLAVAASMALRPCACMCGRSPFSGETLFLACVSVSHHTFTFSKVTTIHTHRNP